MTVSMPFGEGRVVLLDEDDLPLWHAHRWGVAGGEPGRYYVGAAVSYGSRHSTIYLHRLIMQAPSGVEVDHINGNRLDNRRCNLRLVTRSQNEQNKKHARSDSSTGVRGVEYVPDRNKYRARIWLNGKGIHLGYYATQEEAATAAAEGRRRYFTHAPESEVA